jgi:hypothetical protein
MESRYLLINLVVILLVNVLLFFFGVCLNSLVILSFWRSPQLRKRLCYFMIMVLSCCDLLAVLTNHPFMILVPMLRLMGKLDVYPGWLEIYSWLSIIFPGISLLALLVMNFDRYLATYHPIFHRTSVTRKKLSIILVLLCIFAVILMMLSVKGVVISYTFLLVISSILVFPPMIFINYKLFRIVRRSRKDNVISPGKHKRFSLKNISSCLLAVACFLVLTLIPTFVYIALSQTIKLKETKTFNTVHLVGLWTGTIYSMNSTLNCLIFYWRDSFLRAEGMKVIKSMKTC